MSISINVAGVWKTDAAPSINVAGVWKTPDSVDINVAGVWKNAYSGLSVSARADGRSNTRLNAACYNGCYFYSNGTEYEVTNSGGVTNSTTWLDSGTGAEVWVNRVVTSGSWNSLDPGTGRYQLSSNRLFRMIRSAAGVDLTQGYWRFYDAASGGNLLQQTASSNWYATYEFEGCPLCCFTPDTLITMASGIEMPIGKVQAGDKIIVKNPHTGQLEPEAVGEVIVRVQRDMYRIWFEDGTHINASSDHPFHVGRGYAAINPIDQYKDLETCEMLQEGDLITHISGPSRRIVKIRAIDYPYETYTFSNSFWFANGNLVY